ncbi:MAG: glycine betaine ABC transporter substrate-binding protein [Myxococcota bacterium]
MTPAFAADEVVVGSKAFTESVVLGELAVDWLEAGGTPARHRPELGGTRLLWTALLAGEIDVYPEYTGTIRAEILGDPSADLTSGLAAHHVRATRSLGFSDTYALGMVEARAAALGVTRISDLAAHPELPVGLSHEFLERADGWPALVAAYHLPQTEVRGLQHDLAYPALTAGAVGVIDLYSTDAEIARHDVRVLTDDKGVFPPYDAVYLFRDDLPEPAVDALRAAEGTIDAAAMVRMNAAAKLDGRPESEVAAEFVRGLGVAAEDRSESLGATLRRTTVEHLRLVLGSLTLSIALALPLGVVAARAPRVAPAVLGAVGLVQTIPSIALLVALIPALGIGEAPALVALVVYGLLPIARNTHAGLTSIPGPLRDVAVALGLPPWARLWRIELPLAAPAIWAGIKTAAVTNVGTATLGALVGAGGYGQPILAGIRLARADLILLGAVPAAGMALALQLAFDRLERRLAR